MRLNQRRNPTKKCFALGLGGLIGLSHIGMIGTLMKSSESKLPSINLPVGPYTSYKADVSRNGYYIEYKANDPKVMRVERDIKTKGGFLGLGNNKTRVDRNSTRWMGQFIQNRIQLPSGDGRSEACIKAIGGAEQTGRLVGSSIGTAAAPTLSLIFPLLVGLLLVG